MLLKKCDEKKFHILIYTLLLGYFYWLIFVGVALDCESVATVVVCTRWYISTASRTICPLVRCRLMESCVSFRRSTLFKRNVKRGYGSIEIPPCRMCLTFQSPTFLADVGEV